MTTWPSGKLYRKTKHKRPRHQLYQPGFNADNGCWLEGAWITVPKDEWERRKAPHQAMYAEAASKMEAQHHADPAVDPEKMTPAQRQAWEFYAGSAMMSAIHEVSGHVGMVDVDLAGAALHPKCAEWLRAEGWKLVRFVTDPQGDTRDQTEGLDIPADLVAKMGTKSGEAVDTWRHVVEQNVANFDAMFESMVEVIEGSVQGPAPPPGMAAMMAFHRLIEVEEAIVRMEWHVSRGEQADPYQTIEGETARYVKLRRRLKKAVERDGDDSFEDLLDDHRAKHNECARTNLDNSDGRLFCYVLPKFHDDGTHEPWGERDVPWNEADPWEDTAEEGAAE